MVSAQDVDRVFLQAVLSRGLMSGELAKALWERSIDVVNGDPPLSPSIRDPLTNPFLFSGKRNAEDPLCE